MRIRPIAVVGSLVLATTIAGCADSRAGSGQTQAPSSGPPRVTSAGRPGTLTGLVTITGGPMTADGRMALDNRPEAGVTVSVTSALHPALATVTDASGRFSLSLPAGAYVVQADCGSQPVTMAAGETTSITLACQVP